MSTSITTRAIGAAAAHDTIVYLGINMTLCAPQHLDFQSVVTLLASTTPTVVDTELPMICDMCSITQLDRRFSGRLSDISELLVSPRGLPRAVVVKHGEVLRLVVAFPEGYELSGVVYTPTEGTANVYKRGGVAAVELLASNEMFVGSPVLLAKTPRLNDKTVVLQISCAEDTIELADADPHATRGVHHVDPTEDLEERSATPTINEADATVPESAAASATPGSPSSQAAVISDSQCATDAALQALLTALEEARRLRRKHAENNEKICSIASNRSGLLKLLQFRNKMRRAKVMHEAALRQLDVCDVGLLDADGRMRIATARLQAEERRNALLQEALEAAWKRLKPLEENSFRGVD